MPKINWRNIFRVKTNREPTLKCHLLLIVVAVGYILDGIVMLVSLGFVNSGFAYETARQLSYARIDARTLNG